MAVPAKSQADIYFINSLKMELSLCSKTSSYEKAIINQNLDYIEKKVYTHYDPFSLEATIEYFALFEKDENILVSYINEHKEDKTLLEYFRKRKNYFSTKNTEMINSLRKRSDKKLITKYYELKRRKFELEKLYSLNVENNQEKVANIEEKFKEDKNSFLNLYFNKDKSSTTGLNLGYTGPQMHMGAATTFKEVKTEVPMLNDNEVLIEIFPGKYFDSTSNECNSCYYFFVSDADSSKKSILFNSEEIDILVTQINHDNAHRKTVNTSIAKLWSLLPSEVTFSIQKAENIYFVSTGSFQSLNWSLLKIKEGNSEKYLCEKGKY
ncbi:MAG: hypothetical protein IPP71_07060 [Bacteroidetes bacterium]|nr:hypothetical protein [Bacteroidota bacterium]